MNAPTPLLRSLLFAPGFKDMLGKAWLKGNYADAIVPDLEDSVSTSAKAEARINVRSFIEEVMEEDGGPVIIPRVNSLASGLLRDDLEAVLVRGGVFGVSVPKIETRDDLRAVNALIEQLRPGMLSSVYVFPWIETCAGVARAADILAECPPMGACWGADDYRADLGISRPPPEHAHRDLGVAHARAQVALAANANKCFALDTPWVDVRSDEGLAEYIQESKLLGYTGMFCIHPKHIDEVNRGFSPEKHSIVNAAKIVQAFSVASREGRGSIRVDNKMVDVPVFTRAANLLKLCILHPEKLLDAELQAEVPAWRRWLKEANSK